MFISALHMVNCSRTSIGKDLETDVKYDGNEDSCAFYFSSFEVIDILEADCDIVH